ncbi:hypothetical protein NCLIV_032230 [Neospora caninum Liverpool]|uniref:snRNA-activating of 50 kDa MW carboxy-terminal protein n=1 Tax=Neospora caninum (strain Liverpool) TaxID=572307 RepID=F0VI75_NEOCL|nr:hypothetical protein NCLIV_032230 [Neospora caninum Liverpool]CBZ53436.1 hypothetical protein NCLIV_032230 [Neospora caninum Liverpool]CEL67423.1 TPA: hypothetical protein BN1204_032230 [Neospora caninum Liverpool]|eukprot:XP_003883468.1 hypothetical protein NCLIV_032230 [Neospora caninum Liverpool]
MSIEGSPRPSGTGGDPSFRLSDPNAFLPFPSPVLGSSSSLPPGFSASSLEASSLYTNCPPSTFDALQPWKSPSSPSPESSPSLPPASPSLAPTSFSSPFPSTLPPATFPPCTVPSIISASPSSTSSPFAPSTFSSSASRPASDVSPSLEFSSSVFSSASVLSSEVPRPDASSCPSSSGPERTTCLPARDSSLPTIPPPPPPSFSFFLPSSPPSLRFFAGLQHGTGACSEQNASGRLLSRSPPSPSDRGEGEERQGGGGSRSLTGRERHAWLTGEGCEEEDADPLLSSFEELEEGVPFPLPFCAPPEFLWHKPSDSSEGFWGDGGDQEADQFPSLFRGDPQVYRHLLHLHFGQGQAASASPQAKGALASNRGGAEESLVPADLQDEYLAFAPAPFAAAFLSPATFRERAGKIAHAIAELAVPPPPQPLPLRLNKFISFAKKLSTERGERRAEETQGRDGREDRDARRAPGQSVASEETGPRANQTHRRSPSAASSHSSSSPSSCVTSSSSSSCVTSSSLSPSSFDSCLSGYFAFFLSAGVRVPSIEEAVAWSVARELGDWPETLDASVRRSLEEALRHSRARRFNRFSCRVAWPPLPPLCPYSEGNLWVAFRDAVALASFRNVQDLFRSRFSRQVDLHNFALNQHTLQQRAHQKKTQERRRPAASGEHPSACPADSLGIAALGSETAHQTHPSRHAASVSRSPVCGSSSSPVSSGVRESGPVAPPAACDSSEFVAPSEVILSVSFYHASRGAKLASFDLLASQTLLHLRRALLGCCEGEAEPGVPLFPASCFLIDGVLYPDTQCAASETEYAEMLADHLRDTGKLAVKERIFFRSRDDGKEGTARDEVGERRKEAERSRRRQARVERRGRILERRVERVMDRERGVAKEREVWIVAVPPVKRLDGFPRRQEEKRRNRRSVRGSEEEGGFREREDGGWCAGWPEEVDGGTGAGGRRRWTPGRDLGDSEAREGDGDRTREFWPGGEARGDHLSVEDSDEEMVLEEEDVVIIPQDEAVLGDLVLPLRSPACFLHQGTCEHRVVFWNFRQFDPRRDCTYTAAYPVRTYKPAGKTVVCHACEQSLASRGVVNSFLCALHNPTYLCSACYRLLFGDGPSSTATPTRRAAGRKRDGREDQESPALGGLGREEEEDDEPFAVHFDLFDG